MTLFSISILTELDNANPPLREKVFQRFNLRNEDNPKQDNPKQDAWSKIDNYEMRWHTVLREDAKQIIWTDLDSQVGILYQSVSAFLSGQYKTVR